MESEFISRDRNEAIRASLRSQLKQANIDPLTASPSDRRLQKVAQLVMVETGCSYTTARRHMRQLIQGRRSPNSWGGLRPNAGRPRNYEESSDKDQGENKN